jgi:hypothetical protein
MHAADFAEIRSYRLSACMRYVATCLIIAIITAAGGRKSLH